jgi:putative ABC transport system permease protein
VTLLARDLDPADAPARLPLVSAAIAVQAGQPPPVWVSELMRDVYGLDPGEIAQLPIAGRSEPFTVAGVWRDYARQNGALVVERQKYAQLTGDETVTDAGLWLDAGVTAAQAEEQLRAALPGGDRIEIARPGEIRALSLRIFDRSFAATYALEAAAILIGLFGLSSSLAAQVLARRREFGMLRHVGMTRGQIRVMLAFEGLLTSGIGLLTGGALGVLISLILIHVVNRQSFHWGMELHLPWFGLGALAAAMLTLAMLTALASARRAMGQDVVRAVREDW